MKAYYNEFDPKAAQWLRQLIANGLIMDGIVDDRSIIDVQPEDLKGFTRHHFFAGIGGWELALQLADWPIDRPVCTASLPCQPFSVAGAQKGKEDARHLLPHFIELVKQCNFDTIFGEQVPGAIKHGWLDDLCTEMEREKYQVGKIVLTAAGTGAPHIRQRLYWVADSINTGSQGRLSGRQDTERETVDRRAGCSGTVDGLGDTELHGHNGSEIRRSIGESEIESGMLKSEGSNTDGRPESQLTASGSELKRAGSSRALPAGGICDTQSNKEHTGTTGGLHAQFSHERTVNDWSDPDWLHCRDEKYRPIKPSIEPLANGLPRGMGYSSDPSEPIEPNNTQEARVMRLKGYGNAIVPQVAASFIQAFLES